MKILLLLLSTLALSSIVLAMPTTGRDKKLLETLLGEKDDDLALEQDMDPDLPPYQPSGEEKKDARALLQAMAQWFHVHFHWAKAQDGEDGNGDLPPYQPSGEEKKDARALLQAMTQWFHLHFHGWAKAQDGEDGNGDLPPYQPSGEEKKDARALLQAMTQWFHLHFHGWAKAQDGEDGNGDTQPTRRQEKKYLEALLKDKNNDDLALEEDMDPDLPPYQPSGEEKKDALALLQAMTQWFHVHFHFG